jgi:ABC-type antimicrobial peptide transport system permease subunit
MATLLRRLRHLFNRERYERELAEEIETHRAMLKERLLPSVGQDPPASRRVMGNTTLAREDARSVWVWSWLDSTWQDVRYAVRNLGREPGFALLALATLGIGIGVNTSLLTVFNALFLRPWPVPDPSTLFEVTVDYGSVNSRNEEFSFPEYLHLREHARSVSGLIASACADNREPECRFTLDDERVSTLLVSRNYFDVLGIAMEQGPGLAGPEAKQEAIAVISYGLWEQRFAADRAIIGKTVHINSAQFTVLGVAPRDFGGTSFARKDVWIPLGSRDLAQPHGGYPLFGLLGLGTFLVLVLACANVGNLLLARSAARSHELAVRMSLGAGHSRLLRQLLTESLVIAGAAALAGGSLAFVIPRYFVNWIYVQFGAFGAPAFSAAPDGRVLVWTAALVIVTCVTFGLAPSLYVVRRSVATVLKREGPIGGTRLRLRSVLLTVQVVVSVVLLAGAALLVRSARHAATFDFGFTTDNIIVLSLDPPPSYDSGQSALLSGRVMEAFADLLPTESLAVASTAPFGAGPARVTYRVSGQPTEQHAAALHATAGYFELLGISLTAGRVFDDSAESHGTIVINERLARTAWPGESPLGRSITVGGTSLAIIGVVEDADTEGRILRGRQVPPAIYRPVDRTSFADGRVPQVIARATAAANLAARLKSLDLRVAVLTQPLSDSLDRQLAPQRMGAIVAGVLSIVALTFASIGVFGVCAYIVHQRTREIGVRMALGAQRGQVVRFILRSSSPALLIGLALGFIGAILASKVIASSLIGISPFDPFAYLAVMAALACAAVFAVLVPASRATRVDPVKALRCE